MATSPDPRAEVRSRADEEESLESARSEAATLKDEETDDDEETKLAPLTAAATAAAAEIAHASEVQRTVRREPSGSWEEDEDDPTQVSRKRVPAGAPVPDLAFDEPPREQTALMPGAPGRVPASSANMQAAVPGSQSRQHAQTEVMIPHEPSGSILRAGHVGAPAAFSSPPLGPRPDSGDDELVDFRPTRWWLVVTVFAVIAVAVPFAVYFALHEDAAPPVAAPPQR